MPRPHPLDTAEPTYKEFAWFRLNYPDNRPNVLSACLALCNGNAERSALVEQEVAIRAWLWGASKHDPKLGEVASWLFTLAKSAAQHNKRNTHKPKREGQPRQPRHQGFTVESILAPLMAEEREIVALHVVDGLSFKETAKRLGRDINWVHSSFHSARNKLRAQDQEQNNDSLDIYSEEGATLELMRQPVDPEHVGKRGRGKLHKSPDRHYDHSGDGPRDLRDNAGAYDFPVEVRREEQ